VRVGGAKSASGSISAPGYGSVDLAVTSLGYGVSVAHSVGESRRSRTFYPNVKTSGAWYIEVSFPEVKERSAFAGWMLFYIARITDPYQQPLAPMTVSVPSSNFMKTGYPTSSIDFGDAVGTAVYRMVVQFTSASDPLLLSSSGSRYSPPSRDSAARNFYPAGIQSSSLPDPAPLSAAPGPDDPWNGGLYPMRLT